MADCLTQRYADRLIGTLSCFDRIVITGTLPGICYAQGMTSFLYAQSIRIFDYAKFAAPLRERIRQNAAALAEAAGIEIEHIRQAHLRKEAVVAKVLEQRGDAPGLVHILSAMEACQSYKPWHDKATGKTFLKPDSGKCLHYYFYFIDKSLGLCYLRVPTWCPFRLQFYCNGHSWLARTLSAKAIDYTLADNAFLSIADLPRAQALADAFSPKVLHRCLDAYAKQCCPVLKDFGQRYHWSLMQIEYSTDLLFRSAQTLGSLYDQLARQSVLSIKAPAIATFLGRKISPQLAQELGSRFTTRIEGTCIKHRLGKAGIKMYDKFGRVLRLETTLNDVSFFKHHRAVEHRQGKPTRQLAPMRKTIYSLSDLRPILRDCNRRYLEFLSALDDTAKGERDLTKLTESKHDGERTIKGINFFAPQEQRLLRLLQRGEFNIRGLRRADLIAHWPEINPTTLSRHLKRFRILGILKRAAHSYSYYLTRLGRAAIAAACSLTQFNIIPALAHST